MLSDGSRWDFSKWTGIHYERAAWGCLGLQQLVVLWTCPFVPYNCFELFKKYVQSKSEETFPIQLVTGDQKTNHITEAELPYLK